MASPPKPWERQRPSGPVTSATQAQSSLQSRSATSTAISAPAAQATSTAAARNPLSTTSNGSGAPPLPTRPEASALVSTVNQAAAGYSAGVSPAYGGAYGSAMTPYGTSPYNRFGSYGAYGGAYGAGMYSPYGGGYTGAYGGMYGRPMGFPGNPNDPNSLTNRFNQSTQATFQIIEGLVGAFTGFSQMLESTYMATHSSFFAMVSVAEQFGNLRDALGSILGIFTLLRWIRTAIARLTGRPPPADGASITAESFARFEGRNAPAAGPNGAAPRPSRKPFLFFLAAAFGLPYILGKLIRALAASQREEEERLAALAATDPAAAAAYDPLSSGAVDLMRIEFCRVEHDYAPASRPGGPGAAAATGAARFDLEVKKGDNVAVLQKTDPAGNPSDWWRCRTRDGRVGYLPSNYLRSIGFPSQRIAEEAEAIRSGAVTTHATGGDEAAAARSSGGRTNTMTTTASSDSRTSAAPSTAATSVNTDGVAALGVGHLQSKRMAGQGTAAVVSPTGTT